MHTCVHAHSFYTLLGKCIACTCRTWMATVHCQSMLGKKDCPRWLWYKPGVSEHGVSVYLHMWWYSWTTTQELGWQWVDKSEFSSCFSGTGNVNPDGISDPGYGYKLQKSLQAQVCRGQWLSIGFFNDGVCIWGSKVWTTNRSIPVAKAVTLCSMFCEELIRERPIVRIGHFFWVFRMLVLVLWSREIPSDL